jgi:integration host factor subunit beta
MTKTQLIEKIAQKTQQLNKEDIHDSCNVILQFIIDSLIKKNRIEVRGFGSFDVHYHKAKVGRNPKTGNPVDIDEKFVPYFRPGKKLKQMVNNK